MMMSEKKLEFRILWNSSPPEHVNTQEYDVWFGVITLTFLFFIDENRVYVLQRVCREIYNFSITEENFRK